jgi:hypothetical protein
MSKSENAELLAQLQAEGRAPKVGDVVTRRTGSHTESLHRAKVEAVRARKLKWHDALYVTAGGVDYVGTPDMKGWHARRPGGGWSYDSIGPFNRAAHAEQDEKVACRNLRAQLEDAAKSATSKQLRAALAALEPER